MLPFYHRIYYYGYTLIAKEQTMKKEKKAQSREREILISIFLGSGSDVEQMSKGFKLLDDWQMPYRLHILSAHRTPDELDKALALDITQGARVIIGAAGMAAHLPGVLASKTILPVIGVPLASGALNGQDALYSIVQMPPGIPVACVAIGSSGAQNAVILAAQILGGTWLGNVQKLREDNKKNILKLNQTAEEKGFQAFL